MFLDEPLRGGEEVFLLRRVDVMCMYIHGVLRVTDYDIIMTLKELMFSSQKREENEGVEDDF